MLIELSSVSAAIFPYLKDYIETRVQTLAGMKADGLLASIYRKVVPDETLKRVNEIFVSRFEAELNDVEDLPSLSGPEYQRALISFLTNPSVQDALQAPLDGESELDWQLLRGIWEESRTEEGSQLVKLPEGFVWSSVATKFKHRVVHAALHDPELRPVIQALADLRMAKAIEKAERAVSRILGPQKLFSLDTYAEAIQIAFAYLRLGSMDGDWTRYEQRVRLDNVYVPQSVRRALPPPDLLRDYRRELLDGTVQAEPDDKQERLKLEYFRLSPIPLMEVVDDDQYRRLVIVGDPGLGKSTLLKHLALRWADERTRPLTLVIELGRASRRSSGTTLLDFLESGASPLCCFPRTELDRYLKASPTLVLFDGLDEVQEPIRTDTVADIIRMANEYSNIRVIVTTRLLGYYPSSPHPEEFLNAGFEQFTLQDFSNAERDRFIDLWYQHAFMDSAEATSYKIRLQQGLEESSAVTELASIPLLLTMMAILSRKQYLPRERHSLYEKCAELLLEGWDLDKFPELRGKKGSLDAVDKLGPAQKMRILERVASRMLVEATGLEGNLIPGESLRAVINDELKQLEISQAWSVAQDLVWMLGERNFMLANIGDDQYGFIHRSFQEYFCARAVKFTLEQPDGLGEEGLRRWYRDGAQEEQLHEVMRLLSAMISPGYVARGVEEILLTASGDDHQRQVVVAAQCLGEARRNIDDVSRVRAVMREKLVELLESSIAVIDMSTLDGKRKMARTLEDKSRAVRELAKVGKDDKDTFLLLVRLARRLATLPKAIHGLSTEDGMGVLFVGTSAFAELAMRWPTSPVVVALCKRFAKADEFDGRLPLVVELLSRWGPDPASSQLLQWYRNGVVPNPTAATEKLRPLKADE